MDSNIYEDFIIIIIIIRVTNPPRVSSILRLASSLVYVLHLSSRLFYRIHRSLAALMDFFWNHGFCFRVWLAPSSLIVCWNPVPIEYSQRLDYHMWSELSVHVKVTMPPVTCSYIFGRKFKNIEILQILQYLEDLEYTNCVWNKKKSHNPRAQFWKQFDRY